MLLTEFEIKGGMLSIRCQRHLQILMIYLEFFKGQNMNEAIGNPKSNSIDHNTF
jgi:hypothetical protein